jgi:hypothetical protein
MVTLGIVDINNFHNKIDQTLHYLTFEKSYMHYIVARREYILVVHLVDLLLLMEFFFDNFTICNKSYIGHHKRFNRNRQFIQADTLD